MTRSKFVSALCTAFLCIAGLPAIAYADAEIDVQTKDQIHTQSDKAPRYKRSFHFPPGSASVTREIGFSNVPLTRLGDNQFRINNASETASYYFITGVRQFKKRQYDRAERSLEAVLRADGLDKEALHYLVAVSMKKGETDKAQAYAKRWAKLVNKSELDILATK